MRAQVTIREVARLAEVHPSTVSRALNEETRFLVNPDTAARVLRAAAELGYRPNPIARGLKTNRSYTEIKKILEGLVSPSLDDLLMIAELLEINVTLNAELPLGQKKIAQTIPLFTSKESQ